MATSRTVDAVLEVLTQRRALARANELARATERQSALRRAREKRDVAEMLWPSGRTATALRSIVAALGEYELALEVDADDDAALAEEGFTASEAATLRRARTVRAASAPLPDEDGDLATTHAEAFADVREACDVLDAHLGFVLRSPDEVRVVRSGRAVVVGVASVLVGGLLGAAWTLPFPPSVSVTASSTYGDDPRYSPELALDGDPGTEWLLPDAMTGTLDVHFTPARDVRSVRIWNGHNYSLGDRGIARFRIELWSFARRISAVEGVLPAVHSATALPVVVTITGRHVDRVRLVVLSWQQHGASLAELEVK